MKFGGEALPNLNILLLCAIFHGHVAGFFFFVLKCWHEQWWDHEESLETRLYEPVDRILKNCKASLVRECMPSQRSGGSLQVQGQPGLHRFLSQSRQWEVSQKNKNKIPLYPPPPPKKTKQKTHHLQKTNNKTSIWLIADISNCISYSHLGEITKLHWSSMFNLVWWLSYSHVLVIVCCMRRH